MSLGEFGRIARFFRPLACDFPGGLNLADDAAFLKPPPGMDLVISTDALVEGVHVPLGALPFLYAQKVLRTNLSDLAAKGAVPICYFLTLAVPRTVDDAWVAQFADGLGAVQSAFDVRLAGGDSVSTDGPVVISVTIIGQVPHGQMIRRGSAQIGDVVYVTGWIGDGLLGLADIEAGFLPEQIGSADYPPLERYWCPRPRLDLAAGLRGRIHAAADISDGLVADLEKICLASNVSAMLDLERVPFSPTAQAKIKDDPTLPIRLVTAGDDYELVCTGPAGLEATMPLWPIGRIILADGAPVATLCQNGQPIVLTRTGWCHGGS